MSHIRQPIAGADEGRVITAQSLIGRLRQRHGRRLAIPALFIALVSATLAVTAVIGRRSDGDASNTTNAIIVVPTSGVSTAQPPPRPISAAPAPAATSTGPVATVMLAPASPVAGSTTPLVDEPDQSMTNEQVETFVRTYYGAVAAGDYETSWSQLAPEFQRGKARSYDYYVGFWNDNDIEVGDVELVESGDDRAVVRVELRWNGSNTAQIDQFTLRLDETGHVLIAGQTTLGND